MRTCILLLLIFGLTLSLSAQSKTPEINTGQGDYIAKQKVLGKTFSDYFYPGYAYVHRLSERGFVAKIDSVRNEFSKLLSSYQGVLEPAYVTAQQLEIKLYFDKLLINYPTNHEVYTGSAPSKYPLIMKRVAGNLSGFNTPSLLSNDDFTDFVKSFLDFKVNAELNKPVYAGLYNKRLDAMWNLLSVYFKDKKCLDFWRFNYLTGHIDRNGIKNTDSLYAVFRSTCQDTNYLNKMETMYDGYKEGLKDHLVREYKKLGTYGLDLHIFTSDSLNTIQKKPVIIFFHGGSWSEGQPAWHFEACRKYAQKGWVACAVEYRIYGNQGTLPFEAVMDARSAIRWLRKHAQEFNIDTGRIVATGNSAGGHLVLASALAKRWNEKTDDLKYSPVANVLLVNSGVYDLTDEKTSWIRKDLKNKKLVEDISPNYTVDSRMPPTLIIHGKEDQNVPFASAVRFVEKMSAAGNNCQFKPIENGGHFIFFEPKYTPQVFAYRKDFLLKLGYPDNDGE
ncbi:MAG: alpha/beta hydrolase [Filimonas sp.]|nr:alpha/beta hydrolase [Filimonas sp.]